VNSIDDGGFRRALGGLCEHDANVFVCSGFAPVSRVCERRVELFMPCVCKAPGLVV
jgi:hypothetical protein